MIIIHCFDLNTFILSKQMHKFIFLWSKNKLKFLSSKHDPDFFLGWENMPVGFMEEGLPFDVDSDSGREKEKKDKNPTSDEAENTNKEIKTDFKNKINN